ncbi:MAG: hypothetical protein E6H71_05710, partial [Betaproteobacteria bacterium]
GGRIVKTAGDGLLAEFTNALAALRASIQIQKEMAARNQQHSGADRLEYRIGVNLGDIMVDANDIAGDGVNIASRLESLAKPGGICVSSAVREQLHGQMDMAFIDIGEQQVKNIARPIRAYAVDLKAVASTRRDAPAPFRFGKTRLRVFAVGATALVAIALAGIGGWWAWQRDSGPPHLPLAIAMMPLSTPDGNAESTLLGDRITKDLRVAIGRSIRDAPLVAASRANAYTGKPADPRATARDLNARYLVEGDARRDAGQVTMTLQLVDGETGSQAWSTQVSLPETQTVGEASPMINRLTWRLRKAFDAAEIARALTGRASSSSPPDLVARANAQWTFDVATAFEARKLFDAALRIDPRYVPALVGRAWTLNHEYEDDPKSDRERIVREMDDLAQRAIDVDPGNSRAWRTRATALGWQGRYDSALEASAQAIRLDPSNKDSLILRGWIMDVSGQAHNTPALLELSRAVDPDVYAYEMDVACEAYVLLGRFKDAAEACSKAAALENWAQNQVWLIAALAELDDRLTLDAAKKELLRKQPNFTIGGFRSQHRSRHPVWVKQADENLYAGLRKAGLPE